MKEIRDANYFGAQLKSLLLDLLALIQKKRKKLGKL